MSASADMSTEEMLKLLEANKDVQFVDRVRNPGRYPYPTISDNGRLQTHFMAAEFDERGQAYAFPMVVMEAGKYRKFEDPREALNYNKKKGNVIPFGEDIRAADDFSRNYKPKSFKEFYQDKAPAPGMLEDLLRILARNR